eukprot:Opistho-2@35212
MVRLIADMSAPRETQLTIRVPGDRMSLAWTSTSDPSLTIGFASSVLTSNAATMTLDSGSRASTMSLYAPGAPKQTTKPTHSAPWDSSLGLCSAAGRIFSGISFTSRLRPPPPPPPPPSFVPPSGGFGEPSSARKGLLPLSSSSANSATMTSAGSRACACGGACTPFRVGGTAPCDCDARGTTTPRGPSTTASLPSGCDAAPANGFDIAPSARAAADVKSAIPPLPFAPRDCDAMASESQCSAATTSLALATKRSRIASHVPASLTSASASAGLSSTATGASESRAVVASTPSTLMSRAVTCRKSRVRCVVALCRCASLDPE